MLYKIYQAKEKYTFGKFSFYNDRRSGNLDAKNENVNVTKLY